MCVAFYAQFLNIPRNVWTQSLIVGILPRWGSIDASLKNLGIIQNKGCEKVVNFRLFSTLEQCLSAFYDVASLKGQPSSMLPSHWETASVYSRNPKGWKTNRGRASEECRKKAGRFSDFRLGRLASQVSRTQHEPSAVYSMDLLKDSGLKNGAN